MGKLRLKRFNMSSSAYVEEAQKWAKSIVRDESRFPGDYGSAMRRLASKIGVSFTLLWRLHYKLPKSIDVENYLALAEFFSEREQARKYGEERHEANAKTALGRYLLRSADRISGEEDGAVNDD